MDLRLNNNIHCRKGQSRVLTSFCKLTKVQVNEGSFSLPLLGARMDADPPSASLHLVVFCFRGLRT